MSSPGHVRTLKRQRCRFFGGQGCIVETQTTVEDRIPLSDNFHVEDRYVRNTMVHTYARYHVFVVGSVASDGGDFGCVCIFDVAAVVSLLMSPHLQNGLIVIVHLLGSLLVFKRKN